MIDNVDLLLEIISSLYKNNRNFELYIGPPLLIEIYVSKFQKNIGFNNQVDDKNIFIFGAKINIDYKLSGYEIKIMDGDLISPAISLNLINPNSSDIYHDILRITKLLHFQ